MAKNRWKHISASLMLMVFVQALLLASLHYHQPISDTVVVAEHTPQDNLIDLTTHQDCPVCQFLSTVQLDAVQVSVSIHCTPVTELFVCVPVSPVIGQTGFVSLRAPPFSFC